MKDIPNVKEFYENLKKKREEKGISLDEIHRKSRLSLEYLRAIEAGQIDKLPEGYERIYLKRYAKEIGLDEEEVLRDFDLLTGRIAVPEQPAQPRETKEPKKAPKPKEPEEDEDIPEPPAPITVRSKSRSFDNLNLDRLHRVFWVGLAAVVFVVVAYFTYQQYMFQKENQDLKIKEITISELMNEPQQPGETTTPAAQSLNDSAQSVTAQTPQFIIELRALERIWIREIVDSRDTSDYILTAGLKRSAEAAQQVQLILGRADGVEIWLNGSNLGVMGGKDQIAYVVVNNDGIAQKRLRTVTKESSGGTGSDTTDTTDSTIIDSDTISTDSDTSNTETAIADSLN